jgi:integrase
MKEYEGFCYLWYNTITKKKYLGKHIGSVEDNYAHSSKIMESFKMDSVPPYMKRRIIFKGSKKEVTETEGRLLNKLSKRPEKWKSYYNIHKGLKNSANKRKRVKVCSPKKTISKEEFDFLLEHTENTSRKRNLANNRLILCFLYYSGINYEELWKLKVKDVLDKKGETKDIIEFGGKKMPLYISKTLKEEINKFFGSTLPLYDRESYVFVSQKGSPFSSSTLQCKIAVLLRSAKLSIKVNFRTSFVKTLIERGIETHVVRKLARVKNLEALMQTYYYDEPPPDLLKVLNSIDL